MHNPSVTYIMAAFNNEATISKSINSILAQDYCNFDILLLDDGSSDSTYDIMKKFADDSNKIKVLRNSKNIGLTKSLNILINQSNSEFISRQDADDFSYPNRTSSQMKFLIENQLDACTAIAVRSDNNKNIPRLSRYVPLRLITKYKNPFIHGTLLVNRKKLNSVNNYDENFELAQDYKLMLDFIKKKYKVKIQKKVLYQINMENNISSLRIKDQNYYANCAKKGIVPLEKR